MAKNFESIIIGSNFDIDEFENNESSLPILDISQIDTSMDEKEFEEFEDEFESSKGNLTYKEHTTQKKEYVENSIEDFLIGNTETNINIKSKLEEERLKADVIEKYHFEEVKKLSKNSYMIDLTSIEYIDVKLLEAIRAFKRDSAYAQERGIELSKIYIKSIADNQTIKTREVCEGDPIILDRILWEFVRIVFGEKVKLYKSVNVLESEEKKDLKFKIYRENDMSSLKLSLTFDY